MLKLFRNIRQTLLTEGKTSKYLKYAFGEIVLVVLGILIALQINNWNEARKENNNVQDIYKNLLSDLKADSISYAKNMKDLEGIRYLQRQLYNVGIKNDKSIVLEQTNNIRFLPNYNPITKENDPFIATKITNDRVRKEILTYFRSMKDMDDFYSELDDIIKNKMRPYLGDKKMYELSSWFERKSGDTLNVDFIDKTKLIALSKKVDFQQILFEASLKIENNIDVLETVIKHNTLLISVIKNELN